MSTSPGRDLLQLAADPLHRVRTDAMLRRDHAHPRPILPRCAAWIATSTSVANFGRPSCLPHPWPAEGRRVMPPTSRSAPQMLGATRRREA
jgi:hypothetical protein